MLKTKEAEQYARSFLDARSKSENLAPISASRDLSIDEAYQITGALDRIRTKAGEIPVGRKLGWTNRSTWDKAPHSGPLTKPTWGMLYSSTVRYLDDTQAVQSLAGAMRPKIEPEVVFKLGRTPAPDATPEEVADCLEWMAHGLELVVSPYPDWQCTVPDAIAALGMHGMLIVGEPRVLSSASRQTLGRTLANASVSMSCGDHMVGAGYGSNVMENPVHAIWHLHQLLNEQAKTDLQSPTLQAGEIITSGTWMGASLIHAGETWTTAFSGVSIPGLTVSFI
jgi:2-keto-4-pentenoate hydratase